MGPGPKNLYLIGLLGDSGGGPTDLSEKLLEPFVFPLRVSVFCCTFTYSQCRLLPVSSITLGLPWWLRDKAFACNVKDPGLIPGSGRSPGDGNGNPLQYCCLENSVGDNPWGCKELDTTEQLHFHFLNFFSLTTITVMVNFMCQLG